MKRHVMLLELTCCAEEGINAAQLRKEVRYHELVENIKENNWNAELLTIELVLGVDRQSHVQSVR